MTATLNRRWFRFSLRTMFAVVTAAVVSICAFPTPTRWVYQRFFESQQAKRIRVVEESLEAIGAIPLLQNEPVISLPSPKQWAKMQLKAKGKS